jgi:hypothetical protein
MIKLPVSASPPKAAIAVTGIWRQPDFGYAVL